MVYGEQPSAMKDIRVTAFRSDDRPELYAMLEMSELATEDLTPKMLADFLIARQDGVLVGIAGLERYPKAGLLRSVVVDKSLRGVGLGRRLVMSMEDRARGRGLKQLYLLTTTADAFFLAMDYRPLDRLDAPPGIRHSQQFSRICPSDSTFMTKTLK